MADFSINLDGLTVDLAVNGNVFDVLSIVSQHLRQQAVPESFIEDMFNMVLSSSSYTAAMTLIWATTGTKFVFHGRPAEFVTGRAH